MRKFKFFLLLGLTAVCFGLLSCQSSNMATVGANQFDSDVVAAFDEGNYSIANDGDFWITKDQSSNSLHGDFKFDNKKIKFETYRGSKISDAIRRLNPSFPEYEIDVRLLDENSFPFFIQVGGHSPANQSWAAPLGIDSTKSREGARASARESFTSAKKMIKSLEKIRFKNDFSPEYEAIVGIKSILESDLGVTLSKSSSSLASGSVSLKIEIWKKPAYVILNIFGDHSGTVLKIYDNSVIYQIWSAANHGTAPGGPGMSLSCNGWFPNRQGFSQAPPTCSSPFQGDMADWWNTNGRHVCNDDTYIQYQRVRDNINPNTTSGTCSDNSLRQYAPSCW